MPRKKATTTTTTTDKKFKAVENNEEIVNDVPTNDELTETIEEVVESPVELIKEVVESPEEVIREVKETPKEIIKEVKTKKPTKTKKTEEVKEVKVKEVKPKQVVALSAKDNFEKQISKTPYKIYQNGVLVCNYNEFLKINLQDKYFEINNKKYVYTGIEIKYA